MQIAIRPMEDLWSFFYLLHPKTYSPKEKMEERKDCHQCCASYDNEEDELLRCGECVICMRVYCGPECRAEGIAKHRKMFDDVSPFSGAGIEFVYRHDAWKTWAALPGVGIMKRRKRPGKKADWVRVTEFEGQAAQKVSEFSQLSFDCTRHKIFIDTAKISGGELAKPTLDVALNILFPSGKVPCDSSIFAQLMSLGPNAPVAAHTTALYFPFAPADPAIGFLQPSTIHAQALCLLLKDVHPEYQGFWHYEARGYTGAAVLLPEEFTQASGPIVIHLGKLKGLLIDFYHFIFGLRCIGFDPRPDPDDICEHDIEGATRALATENLRLRSLFIDTNIAQPALEDMYRSMYSDGFVFGLQPKDIEDAVAEENELATLVQGLHMGNLTPAGNKRFQNLASSRLFRH